MLLVVAVAAAAVVAHATTLGGDFVVDDRVLIVNNEAVRSASEVPAYFARGMWPRRESGIPDTALYRPFVLLTFFLVYQAAGLLPFAFHAVNIGLHAATSVLVLLLLRRVARTGEGAAVVGALVFAVHPVHVESVGWISGVSDLLVTLFVVLAVWLYAQPSAAAYGGALACAAAALLSKETGVVVPVLAFAHDWLIARRVRWWRVGGLAALIVLYIGVRRAALGAALNAPHMSGAAALRALDYALGYVNLVLAPTQLGLYLSPPGRVVGVAAGTVAIALVVVSLVWARRDRVVAFALVWFAVAIAPALALVFNAGSTYAQRFLYLPSVAVAVLVARAAAPALARAPRATAVASAVGVVLLGTATMLAGREWRDEGVVLAQAIRNTPAFPGNYWALGQHHERAGDRDAAARMYLEAARLAVSRERAFVYHSLGRLYLTAGDLDKSLAYHTMELQIDPGSASAFIAIGNIHAQRRDFTRAAQSFEAAWAADQSRWEALYNLALSLAFLGRDDEARQHLQTFARGAPSARYASVLEEARRRLDR